MQADREALEIVDCSLTDARNAIDRTTLVKANIGLKRLKHRRLENSRQNGGERGRPQQADPSHSLMYVCGATFS